MEFKASKEFSKLIKNDDGALKLLSREDITLILQNVYLHDIHAHFIVSPDGTYDDTLSGSTGITPGKIEKLERAYKSGCTLVVKDVENWNEKIIKRCEEFDGATNVHLYLSPENGSGFGWHCDDRDVYVHGQMGTKTFRVKEPDGTISQYKISEDDLLFIPYGAKHEALANERPSVHLSFGVWPKRMTIKNQYENFQIPINLGL